MSITQNRSLWTSVILHLVVLVCLLLATIIQTFLPKEKLHVFEMVNEPASQNSSQSAAPIEVPPDFVLPDLKPMDIPDTVVMPELKPLPVKPTPVEQPAPPQLMSIKDFREKNPSKPTKSSNSQPIKPIHKVPTIDTSKINQNLQNNLPTMVYNPSASLTAAERTALKRYGDELNSRLNRAWIKPSNLTGVSLMVTVVFDVSSSGRISNIRLSPASGNASFDASVKAAFSAIGSGGPTPTGQGHSFTMSFKMVD